MFGKRKPLMLYRHPGLYLELVEDKGRGVFCTNDIKKDETLEVAPLVIFNVADTQNAFKTILSEYIFQAKGLPKPFLQSIGIDDPENSGCLPMGITAICNHMAEPNAAYKLAVDDLSPFAILTATRDIAKGEEISVSYGDSWFLSRTLRR